MDLIRQLAGQELYIDQTATRLVLDPSEIEHFYLPVAKWIDALQSAAPRRLVAIAGPPGSGKTAFAAILDAVLNLTAAAPRSVVVGLDGWHYPNRFLEQHTLSWNGEPRTLRQVKGAPETFDARGAYACLQHIRSGAPVRIPLYSRQLHAPLADAGVVPAGVPLVLVEGNYLLLDEPPWREFWSLFDLCIFLTTEPETLLNGLRQRHLRGGKQPGEVERHVQEVDLPNIHRVLCHSAHADLRVYKADSRRIDRLEWVGAPPSSSGASD